MRCKHVCGIRNVHIQTNVLGEAKLTLQRVISFAKSIDAAKPKAKLVHEGYIKMIAKYEKPTIYSKGADGNRKCFRRVRGPHPN